RDMTRDEVDRFARGRIWSGADAHRLGLVDQLGDLDDAIAAATAKAGLEEKPRLIYLEKERTWKQKLAEQLFVTASSFVGDAYQAPRGLSPVRSLRQLERRFETLLTLDDPNGVIAHCLCEIE
ncbi:MAG TPA: S49 family peptidase, partial [Thermoanaerobaculia bacterium]|nr:S49 family peptidase [Thermoanaerobaculia bacterium]